MTSAGNARGRRGLAGKSAALVALALSLLFVVALGVGLARRLEGQPKPHVATLLGEMAFVVFLSWGATVLGKRERLPSTVRGSSYLSGICAVALTAVMISIVFSRIDGSKAPSGGVVVILGPVWAVVLLITVALWRRGIVEEPHADRRDSVSTLGRVGSVVVGTIGFIGACAVMNGVILRIEGHQKPGALVILFEGAVVVLLALASKRLWQGRSAELEG